MQGEEILRIIRRITRDFAPLLPDLRLEVVPPEGFRARVSGKPIIADEAMLRSVLNEEAVGGPRKGRPLREQAPGSATSGERMWGEKKRRNSAEGSPLCALPSSRTIVVEMESLEERVNREDRRLHRPLVEGLILREVLYLMTSRQPLPDPRVRAEHILRRHWPFQYAALRSVGLTVTGFERPQHGGALGRDN